MNLIDDNHFDDIADDFNGLWQMTPAYQMWMVKNIVEDLNMESHDVFVDLGGGTGLYTELISKYIPLLNKAFCVEPSEKMLSQIKNLDLIEPINADAISFSMKNISYNKILLKEMVHFINNRKTFFTSIKKQLTKNGKMLIVTRSKKTPLPFFKTALSSFEASQPALDILQNEIREAKMSSVSTKKIFDFNIPKETWYAMLRGRFMSNLQNFTDEEIESGIEELEQKFNDSNSLKLQDELIFIVVSI